MDSRESLYKGKKEKNLRDTQDTSVGDLALDESRAVELKLGTDLKSNGVAARGIPRGLTGGLEVTVDAVVVRSSIAVEVVQGVDSNGVLGSRVTESGVVAVDLHTRNPLGTPDTHCFLFLFFSFFNNYLAIEDVVGDLTTGKEALVANDGVDAEVGLCKNKRINWKVLDALLISNTLKTSRVATVWTLGCL